MVNKSSGPRRPERVEVSPEREEEISYFLDDLERKVEEGFYDEDEEDIEGLE